MLSFGNAGRLEAFGTYGDGRLPRERFDNGLHYTRNAIIIHVHYPSADATAKPRRRILQKIRSMLWSRFSGGDVTMLSAMNKKQPLVGFCPIGKFRLFARRRAAFQGRDSPPARPLERILHVDLESVLPDGIVRDQKHVDAVVRALSATKRIDALFIPHCNFGTEGAAAMIAKKCGVPTLLWGPRDEAPLADGSRLRDSLCGMLATSGVLHTLARPVSRTSTIAASTTRRFDEASIASCGPRGSSRP